MFQRLGKFTITSLILVNFAWGAEIVAKGEPIALTPSGETYMEANWSPDGSHIAVVGDKYNGIYLIDVKTRMLNTLTQGIGAGHNFSWSPDGKTIAAHLFHYEGPWRLSQSVLLSLDGNSISLNQESKQFKGYPKFSDSGDQVYIGTQENLHVYSLKTGEVSPAKNTASSAQRDISLYQDRMDNIIQKLASVDEKIVYVEVSPTNTQIAYTTIGENLWIVDIEGTNRRYLGKGTNPKWSNDGQWIACMTTEDDGHVFTQSDILTYHVTSGDFTNLTTTEHSIEMNPEWSPDGNWIVYENDSDGRIWMLQVERR